ncbi:MAG: alpha-amylase family glycosyl hydrolase [Balneolaceae bacterium]
MKLSYLSLNRTCKTFFPTLLLVLLTVSALGQTHQDWSYNLGIYEVNIRQYTGEGTFNAFTEQHLDRLEDLGVGILWIMPVNPIGQENRLGTLGSYYSVQDYKAVNPNFGTMEDFKMLVQEAHERDMYVILDWVANHTSWDNVLTEEHPEWYVKNNQGEFIPPPGTNWSDVIELDYSNQDLRDYMIETLKFWVDSTGVDGFRFDAVDFVPDDFWSDAVDSLKSQKPDIFLLAESDGKKWHDLGFDMTFGWGLYGFDNGVLLDVIDNSSVTSLSSYVAHQKSTYNGNDYRMYFTSNHDINSWEGTTLELFDSAAKPFAVLTATFNGMPLIYSGQEAGLNERLSFFDKDEINWKSHPNYSLYKTLLQLKKDNKALWNGYSENWLTRIFSNNNIKVFAYLRKMDGDRVFTILNLSNQELDVVLDGNAHLGTYKNVFEDEIITITNDTEISVPAWGFKIYQSGGSSTVSIDDQADIPSSTALHQNYPNPFNPTTNINYQVSKPGPVKLNVYDMLGKKVASLVSTTKPLGNYSIKFNGENLSSGIYIYRLASEGTVITRKMILMK